MNIIHLLSQNHLTGAEVYAATLCHRQIIQGHRVFQLSNGFFYPTEAVKFEISVETKSKLQFLKNVLWLRNFIRKQNIQVVHSHSRAAAKLAYWATIFTRTAQVSTVHGVQHNSISKKLFNQYGEFILAVCENLKTHLIKDFSYNPSRIRVLRNPISSDRFHYIEKQNQNNSSLKIAIVGRTTGPKGERTEQVIKALKNSPHQITLIGGDLKSLNIDTDQKRKITELHSDELTSSVYSQYDLIVGSGRVCMESVITGVKTIAFGEASYIGPVTISNFQSALESNFGDIHHDSKTPKLNESQFLNDLNTQFTDLKKLSEMAEGEFSSENISAKIQRIYESAFFLKNYNAWIPVLMYHKIPDQEIKSEHKIFVTKYNFEKHLKFFKDFGFQTLTFNDIHNFRTGFYDFKNFPKKPLILTFDDGYRDNYENASPLLKKYGFKAQLFLLADPKIDHNKWDVNESEPSHEILSGEERKKWKNSAFEIGSHGFHHKKITEFNQEETLCELVDSKQSLEDEFHIPVRSYAFTYGIRNEYSEKLAEEAGYEYALNTDSGAHLIEEAPHNIFRVSVFPDETSWSLYKKTSKWYRRYYYFKRKK